MMFIIIDTTQNPNRAFLFNDLETATKFAELNIKEKEEPKLTLGEFIEYWKYHREGK